MPLRIELVALDWWGPFGSKRQSTYDVCMPSVYQYVPLGWRKSFKVARARCYEKVGSFKYSLPALNSLDARVLPLLPRDGVFLEVGANDGYSQSNTYYLERALGWNGILIEPLPSLYDRCRRLRRKAHVVQAACVAQAAPGDTIELVDLDLMSVSLGQQEHEEQARRLGATQRRKTVRVPASTLSAVIDGSPFTRIDFMSIDVEGAEGSLLAGLDLDRHAPKLLLIETAHLERTTNQLAPYMRLVDQLSHHDYLFESVASDPL